MMYMHVPITQLGGTAEVAQELGCPKQQIHSLRRRSDFPNPVCKLAATPIWDLREIRSFRDTWKRRSTPLTATA